VSLIIAAGFILAGALLVAVCNAVVIASAAPYIHDISAIHDIEPADCALVPGALVYGSGQLSWVLRDRVDYGIALYNAGKVKKLLLTGDHGQKDYDEVNAMKDYAMAQGVPQDDIFLDHAGFSTYESMYRARDVFRASRVIVVTQEFHLSRAVYNARQLGLDAEGVASNPRRYGNETKDALRESFARVKDFFYVNLLRPLPKYLGEAIPISGSGTATHDKG
jgi:SanA protein